MMFFTSWKNSKKKENCTEIIGALLKEEREHLAQWSFKETFKSQSPSVLRLWGLKKTTDIAWDISITDPCVDESENVSPHVQKEDVLVVYFSLSDERLNRLQHLPAYKTQINRSCHEPRFCSKFTCFSLCGTLPADFVSLVGPDVDCVDDSRPQADQPVPGAVTAYGDLRAGALSGGVAQHVALDFCLDSIPGNRGSILCYLGGDEVFRSIFVWRR